MVHAILYSGTDVNNQIEKFLSQGHTAESKWSVDHLGDSFEDYLSKNVKANDTVIISDIIFVNDDPSKLVLLKDMAQKYGITIILSDSDLQISKASHNVMGRPKKAVPEIEIIVKKRKNKLISLSEALEQSGMSRSAFFREMKKY